MKKFEPKLNCRLTERANPPETPSGDCGAMPCSEASNGVIQRGFAPFYYHGWNAAEDRPMWCFDPAHALTVPLVDLQSELNKVAPRVRAEIWAVVRPQNV